MCNLRLLCMLFCLIPATVFAGDLEAPAEPTEAGSAMYTLADIYNRLNDGTAGTKRTGAFTEPSSGPGPTGHTLDQVMAVAPEVDDAAGAGVANVLEGMTFWGLTSGAWGTGTGTMPDREGDNASTTQTAAVGVNYFTAPEGYYDGEDRVSATDAQVAALDTDISASNIRSGATIFGVAGSAVAATGDAFAYDVLDTKTFSNSSTAGVSGTMPDRDTNNASTAQAAAAGVNYLTAPKGYYDGGDRVSATDAQIAALDAYIASGNIRSTATIFGVEGDSNVVNTTSGDAVAGDMLSGKKAWVDGTIVTGKRYGGCTCNGTMYGHRWCINLDAEGDPDGTVTDLLGCNGAGQCLVWLQDIGWGGGKVAYTMDCDTGDTNNAQYMVNNLNSVDDASLDDGSVKGEWRIPTEVERFALLNCAEAVSLTTPRGFTNIPGSGCDEIWTSDYGDHVGAICPGGAIRMYVWPVRGGQ